MPTADPNMDIGFYPGLIVTIHRTATASVIRVWNLCIDVVIYIHHRITPDIYKYEVACPDRSSMK